MQFLKKALGFRNKKHSNQFLPKELRDEDVYIVSFPKSGNTWLRFIIANLLAPGTDIHLKNIDDWVTDIYHFSDKIDNKVGGRYIKTHHANFSHFPKWIYIYRDYRDVIVSYYYFLYNDSKFKGSLSDFIKSKALYSVFGKWEDHVNAALKAHNENPEHSLILQYEDLTKDPVYHVELIANFLHLKANLSFQEIADNCSFEKLKVIEIKNGRTFDTSEREFFRKGIVNDWKAHFTQNDLNFLYRNDKCKALLLKLGYEL